MTYSTRMILRGFKHLGRALVCIAIGERETARGFIELANIAADKASAARRAENLNRPEEDLNAN